MSQNPRKARRWKFWEKQLKKKKKDLDQPEAESAPKRGNKVQQKHKTKKSFVKTDVTTKKINLSSRGFQLGSGVVTKQTKAVVKPSIPKLSVKDTDSKFSVTDSDTEEGSDSGSDDTDLDIKSAKTSPVKKSHRKKPATKSARYILFVGNLPRTASHEEIVSHFEKRGIHISEFRLLTHKDSGKSKGCGFMELSSDRTLRNALKFHRSVLKGKHINVEVTCGGGGKSEQRKAKITEKNRALRKKKSMHKSIKH